MKRAFAGRGRYSAGMKIIVLFLAVALAGCASPFDKKLQSNRTLTTTIQTSVPIGNMIVVAQPKDGVSEGGVYPESGSIVARKLVAALVPYYPGSHVGGDAEYRIVPEILQWEERATEWSGKPDRLKISLPVYRGGTLIGSSILMAKSSYWTMGGDHPEDLIDAPFDVFAGKLAGKPAPNPLVIEKTK